MKTLTFSNSFLLCCILVSSLIIANAQQPLSQTKKPNAGASANDACLACLGTSWSDADNVKKKDGNFASTTLLNSGFCFQSVCYYSRGLMAYDFNFSIPPAAIISGVRAQVIRKAAAANSAYDYAIQLLVSNLPAGNNKKAPVAWPVIASPKSYGGPSDTWGLTLTSGQVNSSDFGFWLQVQNGTSNNSLEADVDFVRMTVFYSLNQREYSQTSTAGLFAEPLQLFPNPSSGSTTVSMNLNKGGEMVLIIINATGQIMSQQMESVSPGIYSANLDLSAFFPGSYIVQYKLKDLSWTGIVVKE